MSHQDPFPFQSNGFCFFHFQKGKDTTAHLRNSVRCQRERRQQKRAGVRFTEDERGARVLRGAQEPLRWLRLSPYSCKLTPSLSKAKHSLEKSGGRRGRRGGSFYFFFLCPFSQRCSRSATTLLPHTTCRLQRKRLAAEQENAAATPACICGINTVRQVSEKNMTSL